MNIQDFRNFLKANDIYELFESNMLGQGRYNSIDELYSDAALSKEDLIIEAFRWVDSNKQLFISLDILWRRIVERNL